MNLNLGKISTKLALVAISLASSSAFAGDGGRLVYGPVRDVPALSGTMMIILALLLAVTGYRIMQQKNSGQTMAIALLGIAALTSGAGGVKMINSAYASGGGNLLLPGGGEIAITSSTVNVFTNTSGVTQGILQIIEPELCGNFPNGKGLAHQECAVGLNVVEQGTCVIDCSITD